MSDASQVAKSLRERLGASTEDRLGKALSELLENPLLTGAIGRAFDAREKAVQAQEVAMGALNIPSAADIERLTRRLRSVSLRLEGIEDGVERLDRALSPASVDRSEIAQRLSAIEDQLKQVTDRLDRVAKPQAGAKPAKAKTPGAKAKTTSAKAKAPAAKARTRKASASTGRAKPAKA
jgi:chromosome segregation ATPase